MDKSKSNCKNRSKSSTNTKYHNKSNAQDIGNTLANTNSKNINQIHQQRTQQKKVAEFRIDQTSPLNNFHMQKVKLNKAQQLRQELTVIYDINTKYVEVLNFMVKYGFKINGEQNLLARQPSKREVTLQNNLGKSFNHNLHLKAQLAQANTVREQCFKLRNYIKTKQQQQNQSIKDLEELSQQKTSEQWSHIYRNVFLKYAQREYEMLKLRSQLQYYLGIQRQLQENQSKQRERSPSQIKNLDNSQYNQLQTLERKLSKEKKKGSSATADNQNLIQRLQTMQRRLKKSQILRNSLQMQPITYPRQFLDLNREHQYCKSKGKKLNKIINHKQKLQSKMQKRVLSQKRIGTKLVNKLN